MGDDNGNGVMFVLGVLGALASCAVIMWGLAINGPLEELKIEQKENEHESH